MKKNKRTLTTELLISKRNVKTKGHSEIQTYKQISSRVFGAYEIHTTSACRSRNLKTKNRAKLLVDPFDRDSNADDSLKYLDRTACLDLRSQI